MLYWADYYISFMQFCCGYIYSSGGTKWISGGVSVLLLHIQLWPELHRPAWKPRYKLRKFYTIYNHMHREPELNILHVFILVTTKIKALTFGAVGGAVGAVVLLLIVIIIVVVLKRWVSLFIIVRMNIMLDLCSCRKFFLHN